MCRDGRVCISRKTNVSPKLASELIENANYWLLLSSSPAGSWLLSWGFKLQALSGTRHRKCGVLILKVVVRSPECYLRDIVEWFTRLVSLHKYQIIARRRKSGIVIFRSQSPSWLPIHKYDLLEIATVPKRLRLAYKIQYTWQSINARTTMRLLPFLQIFDLFSTSAYAAIGPSANLYIANKFLQPDGFSRS